MADVMSTPTNATAPAAAQPQADAKKTAEQAAQSAAQAQTPQQSNANSAGGRSTPASNAIDEVMKTLPGNSQASEEVEDDGSDLESEKSMTKAEKKAWKLKVGEKDIEITDESELIKRAQMGYSADEKWNEAAKMRKQVENFIGLLQQDPASALEKMGLDVDSFAEQRMLQRIEEMKKSPEQLAHEKLQRELEQLRTEREQERESIRQREAQALQDKYAVDLENEINSAFDNNEAGLPKSPYIVKRMADVMIYALKNKVPDFTAKKALEVVQAEVLNELNQMYSVAPDEVFERLVGKDRLNKYRRAKVKAKTPAPKTNDIKPTGAGELQKSQEDQAPKKIREKDFFKNLGRK